jgi:hypothetical protein
MSTKKADWLWNWLLHESTLFTNRVNFFLVAESMLFAAFATLAVYTSQEPRLAKILGFSGVIISAIWLIISIGQIHYILDPIKTELQYLHPEWNKIFKREKKWIRIDDIIGIILPFWILCVWILLLLFF